MNKFKETLHFPQEINFRDSFFYSNCYAKNYKKEKKHVLMIMN